MNTELLAFEKLVALCAQNDKLIAYSGGLIVFVGYFAMSILLENMFYLRSILIALATIGSYLVFIFEELELKKLRSLPIKK